MNANLRSTGLLLMPTHTPDRCEWCQALTRRNHLLHDKRFVVVALLSLLALIGWEITR